MERTVDYNFRTKTDTVSPTFGKLIQAEKAFHSTTDRTFNNFNRRLSSAGKSAGRFSRVTNRSFRGIGSGLGNLSQGLLNKWTMLFGGAGLGMLGKNKIDFDEKMARIGIKADLSKEKVKKLTSEMLELAKPTFQTKESLAEGIDSILEKTGNFKLADAVKKDLGIISTATDATTRDIGLTMADMNQKLGISGKDMRSAFDILATQGKSGSFELRDMARLFPRILASSSQLGVKGLTGLRKVGAILQIFRRGTGSPEQAATAFERSVSEIIKKRDLLKKSLEDGGLGFDIVKGKTKEGKEIYKDIDVIFDEIMKRSKGRASILNKFFGEESIRGMSALANSFSKDGGREFRNFINIIGSKNAILIDFNRYSETAAAKIKAFKAQLDKFANLSLTGPIEGLTSSLDFLNKHPVFSNKALTSLLSLAGGSIIGKMIGYSRLGPASLAATVGYGTGDHAMKKTSGGALLSVKIQQMLAKREYENGDISKQQYSIINEQLDNEEIKVLKKRKKEHPKGSYTPMFDKLSNLSNSISRFFKSDNLPVFGERERNKENITVVKPVVNVNVENNIDPETKKIKTEVKTSIPDLVSRVPVGN